MMRHVYFRGILGLVWLAAAIAAGVSGQAGTAVMYALLGVVFLYSAYEQWKKNGKGDR